MRNLTVACRSLLFICKFESLCKVISFHLRFLKAPTRLCNSRFQPLFQEVTMESCFGVHRPSFMIKEQLSLQRFTNSSVLLQKSWSWQVSAERAWPWSWPWQAWPGKEASRPWQRRRSGETWGNADLSNVNMEKWRLALGDHRPTQLATSFAHARPRTLHLSPHLFFSASLIRLHSKTEKIFFLNGFEPFFNLL